MEEHHSISMLEIARIYYETSTPSTNLKQLARDFFNSIDYDKDGEVSLCEFLNYMKEKGLINMGNPYVFNALDVNGNGSLEFMEVMALYYIIKSGRPFCGGCGNFIPGMFFSCSICFDNEDDTFSVCPMCFSNGNKGYIHQHKPIHFLDNFALLEAKRKMAMATRKAPPPKDHKSKCLVDEVSVDKRRKIGFSKMVGPANGSRTRQAFSVVNGGQDLAPANGTASNAGSDCGSVEFTREEVEGLLIEKMKTKNKFNLKEKCDQMMEYIKGLRLCIKWFQELEGSYLLEQEKLRNLLEMAEKKCSDMGMIALFYFNGVRRRMLHIQPLQALNQLCDIIMEPLRDRVVTGLLQASLDGLYRVIVDGGPSRVFSPFDAKLLDEDLEVLKEFFISGGDGLPRGVVENHVARIRQVVKLHGCETRNAIGLVAPAIAAGLGDIHWAPSSL